eukprot:1129079-Pleurochrysis_carterae.AAC.4
MYLRASTIQLLTFFKDPLEVQLCRPQAGRAAKYLESAPCPIDVRAKGSHKPKQKWLSAAAAQ